MTSTYEIIIDRHRVRNEIHDLVILRPLDEHGNVCRRAWPRDIQVRVRIDVADIRRRGLTEDLAVMREARAQLARAAESRWTYLDVTPAVPDCGPD